MLISVKLWVTLKNSELIFDMVSLGVVSLFTRVQADDTQMVIRDKLAADSSLE